MENKFVDYIYDLVRDLFSNASANGCVSLSYINLLMLRDFVLHDGDLNKIIKEII